MITKTNWKSDDYFSPADYNRITTNLNEVATELVMPTKGYSTLSYDAILTLSDRAAIITHVRNLAGSINWAISLSDTKTTWFDWKELNIIERFCSDVMVRQITATYGQGKNHGDGSYYGGGIVE